MYISIIISAVMNIVAFAVPRLAALSLSSVLPAAFVLYEAFSCKPTSLASWYWLNCGLPSFHNVITAMTTPFFTISAFAFVLALVGLKEGDRRFFALSAASLLSLLFVWSNYLNLNYPMVSAPPKLPPLGFSVLRGYWFFSLYPLLAIASALLLAYFLTFNELYAKLSTFLAFLTAFSSIAHGHTTYGLPIPPNSFHLSLALLPASLALLFHTNDKASKVVAFLNAYVAFALLRFYPVPAGGLPNPYFGIQTPVAATLTLVYLYSLSKAIKEGPLADKRFVLHYASVIILTAVTVLDLIDNYTLANVLTSKALLWALLASQALSALNFSLVLYLKDKSKLGLLGPASLLRPESTAVAPFALALADFWKNRKAVSSLMVLTSMTFAASLIYASWVHAYFFQPPSEVKVMGAKTVATYTYRGNLTAFEQLLLLNASGSRYEVKSSINVFMGKYIPPNEPAFFSWSVPRWEGLRSCAVSLRPSPLPALKCAPLAGFAYLYPALGALTLLATYIASKFVKPGGRSEGTELNSGRAVTHSDIGGSDSGSGGSG